MSYNVGGSNKGNYKRVSGLNDEESGDANPLQAQNIRRQKQIIDTNLNNIKTQLKKLDEMNEKIGSNDDSPKFRNIIETELKKTG